MFFKKIWVHKLVLKKDDFNYDSNNFEDTRKKILEAYNLNNNVNALINTMEEKESKMHA